jgi:hypothetical protein
MKDRGQGAGAGAGGVYYDGGSFLAVDSLGLCHRHQPTNSRRALVFARQEFGKDSELLGIGIFPRGAFEN